MRRAAAAPARALLWRQPALLLNNVTSHAALVSRSAQLLRGFASLPDGVEELTMPALSPTMTMGNISSWLKKEGEQLQAGDVLCQIETDKAVVDYEMQDEAVLARIVLPEGASDIPVGAVLAYTVEDMDTYESLAASGALNALKDAPATSASAPAAASAKEAAPAAPAAAAPAPVAHQGPSKVTVPHHYSSIDCEIDSIMKLRQELKSVHSVKVSLNDFIIKAVALALRDVPEANCFFDVATKSVQPNKSVDISVAVATAAGLITPIVPKVDALGLSGVNTIFMELVSRARQNKLKPEEFQGGSFTISNLGGFGIDNFTAVINPPQACIMAVGRGRKEVLPPILLEEDAAPRVATLVNVTLSSDRRVVDDVIAGQFLQVFKSYMENPELMVL
uniref:Dihydrolipoamide acetyltransferase component of pyruvate dehydrogenase complex n=1 Tax=Globisporangium ultimum (strain ATCC 200006 / CBS 805.95 / DAOM BR144) TaxID=431595 RepID=K3XA91_GLOUD